MLLSPQLQEEDELEKVAHGRLFWYKCSFSLSLWKESMPIYLNATLLGAHPIGGSECLDILNSQGHWIETNNNCLRISFAFKFQIQGHMKKKKEFQAAIWVGEMNMSYGRDIINFIPVGGRW